MKTNYQILFNKKYLKELKRVPKSDRLKIKEKVIGLAENPRPQGCKKLQGIHSKYRIRCGDYRIVYTIEDHKLFIHVIDVGHRRFIYK